MSALLAPPPPVPKRALGLDEVAQSIGTSLRTVQRLVDSRELVSIKVGRRRLVRVADLDQFLAARVAG